MANGLWSYGSSQSALAIANNPASWPRILRPGQEFFVQGSRPSILRPWLEPCVLANIGGSEDNASYEDIIMHLIAHRGDAAAPTPIEPCNISAGLQAIEDGRNELFVCDCPAMKKTRDELEDGDTSYQMVAECKEALPFCMHSQAMSDLHDSENILKAPPKFKKSPTSRIELGFKITPPHSHPHLLPLVAHLDSGDSDEEDEDTCRAWLRAPPKSKLSPTSLRELGFKSTPPATIFSESPLVSSFGISPDLSSRVWMVTKKERFFCVACDKLEPPQASQPVMSSVIVYCTQHYAPAFF
eukprot:gene31673-6875_t